MFIGEAQGKTEHFKNLIKEKKKNLRESITEVNLELTKNTEILNSASHQNFEADDVLQQIVAEENIKLEAKKKQLKELNTEVEQVQERERIIDQKLMEIFQLTADRFNRVLQASYQEQGLTQRRIGTFQIFRADETHVGYQCSICMEEIDVGRRMRRLTCDGQHYFCQECIEGWFADHNTCPLCRHKFD